MIKFDLIRQVPVVSNNRIGLFARGYPKTLANKLDTERKITQIKIVFATLILVT